MPQNENPKRFDLEDRTFDFAKACRAFIKRLKDSQRRSRTLKTRGKRFVPQAPLAPITSKANEALSKKDFILRIKICRKEAKESRYWLRLLEAVDVLGSERDQLVQEAQELMNIFGAILRKSE